MNGKFKALIGSILLISTPLYFALADGNSNDSDLPAQVGRDGRLPPVLPGETVILPNGEKMKVWSSTGPVPVATAPNANTVDGIGDVDVILDERNDHRFYDKDRRR